MHKRIGVHIRKHIRRPFPSLGYMEFLFFFYVYLLAARATLFTSNLDPRSNLLGFSLAVIPAIYLFFKHRVKFNLNIKIILSVFLLWTCIQYVTCDDFKKIQYFFLFWNILSAYLLIHIFRLRVFYYYEKITVYLACIAIFMWIFMHVVGPENLARLGFMEPASGTSSASFLIFNVPNIDYYKGKGMFGFERNCGFAWEPGLFACFLVIAIFNNLLRTKNKIRNNVWLYILIVALLTTFSTTGYVAFFAIVVSHFVIGRVNLFSLRNIIILVLLGFAAYRVFQLPFMRDKILAKSDTSEYMTENQFTMGIIKDQGELITVDRFEGMALDFMNIMDKPLFGYGISRENSYIFKNMSEFILISNGTTTVFSNFGILLAILFHYFYIKNSIFIRRCFRSKDKSFYLIYMIISFSYSFTTITMFICMSQYYLMVSKENLLALNYNKGKKKEVHEKSI